MSEIKSLMYIGVHVKYLSGFGETEFSIFVKIITVVHWYSGTVPENLPCEPT